MKTPESWADDRWNEFSQDTSLTEWVAKIQADAFTAGERKGFVDGMKHAADWCDGTAKAGILSEVAALQREQQSK